MRWIGLALHAEARAEVQVLLALSRNRRDAEWALGTGSVVAKREGREADMTETKPSTVTDRYFVARKRLERLAAKAGIPKTVSEDLIVVLSVAAAGFTERAARLAAEARADKYRHELWMRETGTSYTDVSDANPNGTFSKRHCFLCDAETRKGASQDTPIPHKPGCLLFGYEPTLALNEHDNG